MASVYILRCRDGSLYTGSARDLETRINEHAIGRGAQYTSVRLPVELVWSLEVERIDEAWELERKLHGWSRAKKQALIDGAFELLPDLASRPKRRRPAAS